MATRKTTGQRERATPRAAAPKAAPKLEITYANLSTALADPRALKQFAAAYARVRSQLGQSIPMLIGGRERAAAEELDKRSPIDTDLVLGRSQRGTAQDARDAVAAARAAFPAWSGLPWKKRVSALRKVAALIDKRLFELSAWLSLDVGKSRAEATAGD